MYLIGEYGRVKKLLVKTTSYTNTEKKKNLLIISVLFFYLGWLDFMTYQPLKAI